MLISVFISTITDQMDLIIAMVNFLKHCKNADEM